jgi:hypothetical protein
VREVITVKTETLTFRIKPETRTALNRIAADKEWSTGHLVNSILTEYVAREGKPGKTRRAAKPGPLECVQIMEPPVDPADVGF